MATPESNTEEYPTSDELMERIMSASKVERDIALATLIRLSKSKDCDLGERRHLYKQVREQIVSNLIELAGKESVASGQFDDKKQGILAAAIVLASQEVDSETINTYQFASQIKEVVVNFLKDHNVKVRLLAGELFGLICKLLGPEVFQEFKKTVLDILEAELQKTKEIEGLVKSPETPIDPTGEIASSEPRPSISPQLGLSPLNTPSTPNIVLNEVLKEALGTFQHSSTSTSLDLGASLGCAHLESCIKTLQFIARGMGCKFGSFVDQQFLDLVYPTLHHPNRFVRESGFYLCAAIIDTGIDLKSLGLPMCKEISQGLSDFCSQTRISAAIACRKFMQQMQPVDQPSLLVVMLPRMCLCRYYMADTKFMLYSQESWKLIFGTEGPKLVTKYIDDVVSYYINATSSDNHAVREAACACIGELGRKIDASSVKPYVCGLLETLRRCFHDDRWHVRDSACLATGGYFMNFPDECKPQLETFFPLFIENLEFPISVVRQGASATISSVVKGYGIEFLNRITPTILEGLENVKLQEPESSVNANAMDVSPELKYSYPPGQCSFLPYARAAHYWEICDGCLYLIGDIAQIPEYHSSISQFIPKILQALKHRTYLQHVVVLETGCKILPSLVAAVGKRQFKEHLEQFFEPIFYSIDCSNSMTSGAGRQCLNQLAKIYGPNIIKARIEMIDPRFTVYVEETW